MIASTDFVSLRVSRRLRAITSGEPDLTGSMPWTRPSRSNRSLNDDFVIAPNLHHLSSDLPKVGDANVVRTNAPRRDMDAVRCQTFPFLLDFRHDDERRAARCHADRHDVPSLVSSTRVTTILSAAHLLAIIYATG